MRQQIRRTVDRHLDRILTGLRNQIQAQGYTQLEVQEVLGWGRSYISQLVTRQKGLRIDQILQILNVINVEPADFFDEIYQFSDASSPARTGGRRCAEPPSPDDDELISGVRRIRLLCDAIAHELIQKNLIDAADLEAAVARLSKATE